MLVSGSSGNLGSPAAVPEEGVGVIQGVINAAAAERLRGVAEVMKRTGGSRDDLSTYREIARSEFPQARQLGLNYVAWPESELLRWMGSADGAESGRLKIVCYSRAPAPCTPALRAPTNIPVSTIPTKPRTVTAVLPTRRSNTLSGRSKPRT